MPLHNYLHYCIDHDGSCLFTTVRYHTSMTDPYRKFTPNGTSDDFVSLLMHAHSLLYQQNGTPLRTKSRFARRWIEPIGNLLGIGMTSLAWLLPPARIAKLQQKLFLALSKPRPFHFDTHSPHLRAAKQLLAHVAAKTGQAPAVLCLFDHPPVDGELIKLNFELSHQAFAALHWLSHKPSRPKLVVATDSLALEHWSTFAEGVYAGFMGTYHLGFDRLGTHRRGLSRLLIGRTASRRMPFRISRILQRGLNIAMAHAGGVPSTARALYAAREYLHLLRQQRDRTISPVAVLTRLCQLSADFAVFQHSKLVVSRLQHSAWKIMESWIVALLAGLWQFGDTESGEACIHNGVLSHRAVAALTACAQALGVAPEAAAQSLLDFTAEFRRNVPQRRRLFRLLAKRVVAKNKPVLLLPLGTIEHKTIAWGEPVVLLHCQGESVTIARWRDNCYHEDTLLLASFAEEFNQNHFS